MAQYGFFFDQSRCSGCHTCAVACKNWHNLPPGPLKYLKVYQYEKGVFPDVRLHYRWVPCYHCQEPACVSSCPTDAIYKDPNTAVLIDPEKCDRCRMCYDACPYGAPVFENDDAGIKAQKCDMCFDRLNAGKLPMCVLSCPSRAVYFGTLGTLTKRYGKMRELEDMPDSKITRPSVIFKTAFPKRQLVPYNKEKALKLLMKRDLLPRIFTSTSDVTEIPSGTVGRSGLVLKHKSAADLMYHSSNDEA